MCVHGETSIVELNQYQKTSKYQPPTLAAGRKEENIMYFCRYIDKKEYLLIPV